MALIVKAHPVDHALGRANAKQAGLGIADLRAGRHRADLDHAETQLRQSAWHLGILVEAGRHADRVGKLQPAQRCPQFRSVRMVPLGREAQTERGDRCTMGRFRIHLEQRLARQAGQRRDAQQGRK
jgi:hypothetical protein